jgi:hypothetical protein
LLLGLNFSFFGPPALRLPVLHRAVMRMCLFMVVAARTAEKEDDFLSVWSHFPSYNRSPIVTTISFGSCPNCANEPDDDEGISPAVRYSAFRALYRAWAALRVWGDAFGLTSIAIPVTPTFELSSKQSAQSLPEPLEEGVGCIILPPDEFSQPPASNVVASCNWEKCISMGSNFYLPLMFNDGNTLACKWL